MKQLVEFFGHPLVAGVVGALIMWMGGWVRSFLAKRLRIGGPVAEKLEQQGIILAKLVPAVNTLIDCKGAELEMLVALGEAMQGKNNGNVTTALCVVRKKAEQFDTFKDKAACIEAVG